MCRFYVGLANYLYYLLYSLSRWDMRHRHGVSRTVIINSLICCSCTGQIEGFWMSGHLLAHPNYPNTYTFFMPLSSWSYHLFWNWIKLFVPVLLTISCTLDESVVSSLDASLFLFFFFLSFKFVFFIWYCYHVVTKFLSIFVSFFRMQWFSHITNRVPRSDNQATCRPSQDVHLENQCAFIFEDSFLL